MIIIINFDLIYNLIVKMVKNLLFFNFIYFVSYVVVLGFSTHQLPTVELYLK
jgi:hypothetical protein